MRKIISTWGMAVLMLVSIAGTAAAQSGVDPSATPTAVPTSQPAAPSLYLHPIVQILSAYFGRLTRPVMPTPTLVPTETATVDPSAVPTETPTVDPSAVATETPTVTPTATPLGPDDFAAQIAMYHDQGMGFGVLVKLYAMAEASVEACLDQPLVTAEVVDPTLPACEAVTVEQLVTEVQGGAGMGQLFKEYGKPALLGVGHVKKAMQDLPVVVPATPTPAPTLAAVDVQTQNQKSSNSNTKGNKPAKVKTPKPHGPKK